MKALPAIPMLALITGATMAVAAGGTSVSVDGAPTPAETAAIQRALGSEYADEAPFAVGHADLNGDHRPDLIARSKNRDFCTAHGCDTYALLATASGYLGKAVGLAYAHGDVIVLPSVHQGMHDLRYEGGSHRFRWNGAEYR